jgi:glutathione S-transferase
LESDLMLTLYYSPGACSMASHIVLNELGVPAQFAKVLRDTKRTEDGEDYLRVNPNGYVPALRLDSGEVLTENAAILPYLGDLKPASGWMPERGMDRYRVLGWLGFINSEIHANYKPLLMKQEAVQSFAQDRLKQRYKVADQHLGEHAYLIADQPSVADAYLFVVTRWAGRVNLDLGEFGNLAAFMARMQERPAVQKTLQEEGLT